MCEEERERQWRMNDRWVDDDDDDDEGRERANDNFNAVRV
jgi:hypothetical protein